MITINNYIQISNEDNMNLMSRYYDNHFDLPIVDPEYGVNASKTSKKPNFVKQKNGTKIYTNKVNRHKAKEWDSKPASKEYGKSLVRCSKNQIVFGANFFDWIVEKTFKPPRRKDFNKFLDNYPSGWIVWDKMNGDSDQWDCELIWTSFNFPSFIHQHLWSGMIQGSSSNRRVQEGNKKLNEKRIHPTQKPVALYKWLLKNYAKPNDKILDTHLGSGSIAIAIDQMNKVEKMNITLTACELDKDYYNDSIKRIKSKTSQLSIFQ